MMERILRKLGLIDDLKFDLPVTRNDFAAALLLNLDPPGYSPFEALSTGVNMYKGSVSIDRFEITRKRRFFDGNYYRPKCLGKIRQTDDNLVVEMVIKGFSKIMVLVPLFLVFFYGIAFSAILATEDSTSLIFLPFLIIHGIFMLGIPYMMLKRAVRLTKYEIERDLFFMMKPKMNFVKPLI